MMPTAPSHISARKSILFVDDDDLILQGLRRMLRPFHDQWEMEFVESGDRALALLDQRPFDVVVSDLTMQGMNGADLLDEVRKRHPKTVRLILSGYANRDLVMRCIDSTHQFLAKPCNADSLRSALVRATSSERTPSNKALATLVTQTARLPSPPTLFAELDEALRSDSPAVEDLGAIIARDIAMSGQVLKLANSAFFGFPRHLQTPAEAVAYLGLDLVRALAACVFLQRHTQSLGADPDEVADISRHSLAVSALANQLAKLENAPTEIVNGASVAGLLHDAGKLILAPSSPASWKEVDALATAHQISRVDAEREVFGCTHQEVGAYLFGLWGLPPAILEAIALHHHPNATHDRGFSALTAVHAANVLVNQANAAPTSGVRGSFDQTYLDDLGLTPRLAFWRQAYLPPSIPLSAGPPS